jgi:2-oxoglutarate ferredoxin oxidoreductase subunit gamma
LVLIDEDLVKPQAGDHIFAIPATRLAEDLGRRIVANVVMLGYFTSVTGLVDPDAMRKTLETSVKAKTVPLNLNAFQTGLEYQAGVGDNVVMERKA